MFPLKKALIIVFLGIFFSAVLSSTSVFLAYLVWFGALAYPLYHYFYKKEKFWSSIGEKVWAGGLWLLTWFLGLMWLGLHGQPPQTVDATVITWTFLSGDALSWDNINISTWIAEVTQKQTVLPNEPQPQNKPQSVVEQQIAEPSVQQPEPAVQTNTTSYQFVSVVDWDTIKIKDASGKKINIRMIWLDTPESNPARYGYIECYGSEASSHLASLLRWATHIQLETDPSQTATDKYGRLLWYVRYQGININQKMIQDGYGFEYTYNLPYKYQSSFKQAQKTAEANNAWLRAASACAGERKAETPIQKETTTKPAPTQVIEEQSTSALITTEPTLIAEPVPTPAQTHIYHTGKKGGCYYYNSQGHKEYVDRSFCY